MNGLITSEQLKERQAMSLKDKIDTSAERIEKWYDYYKGNIYVAFSGGKDSTVLLHLVRSIFPEIPAVFSDTGLEYPEIRNFVKTIDNVVWLKPKISFVEVIEKYGYPVISKNQSLYIYEYRNTKSEKLRDLRLNGSYKGNFKISEKWKFLIDAPFKISNKCCYHLKKSPMQRYERKTDKKPIIGTMAEEGFRRRTDYMKYGCNAFRKNNPSSAPLAFWTEKDVWNYIHHYKIPYSSIYDMGYDRTGCMFCMFGVQRETSPNRFQKMKKTHPKQYSYCIKNLGIGKVMDYIGIDYK